MEKILIIEDEESILMALEDDLALERYEVTGVREGSGGLEAALKNRYDLIILDIMLPDISGFDICRELRRANITTPILILSAKGQEIDKVLGLELGADDYVTKPYSPRELLARIKALLRRVHRVQHGAEFYRFGTVEVDFKRYEVKKRSKPVYLTSLEFALLRLFIDHRDEVLSRDRILDEVWGKDVYVTGRSVDVHIANLRRKIEDDQTNPRFFVGVRGVGYRFTG